MTAAMRAADGKASLPWGAIEAQICERFHKFPEELDKVDVGRLVRSMELAEIYRVSQKYNDGETLTTAENKTLGKILMLELEENGY